MKMIHPWRKAIPGMTVAEVEELVESIRTLIENNPNPYSIERAHVIEMSLWEHVLEVIAGTKGLTGFEARQLAEAALESRKIEFDRW